ncbi:helix-turn-helix domain-containing protein [Gordonia sp. CPCC 205515]|uniref:AraC family transcriptional regulator n=1 Tax=Gordonia sp. CPCC 205515 TaxID=3140791 RepID=UPI003AF39E76
MTEICTGPRRQVVAPHAVPPYLASAASVPGLDRDRVERWRARFVVADSNDAVRRFRGRRGLAEFRAPLPTTASEPEAFEALTHSRQVGMITAVNCLATPCTVTRTSRDVQESADADLTLLIFSTPGRVSVGSSRQVPFRAGQLVLLSSLIPGDISVDTVCDSAQISIPLSAFGSDMPDRLRRLRPVCSDTALVRVATTFIRRFAQSNTARAMSDAADSAAQDAVLRLVRSIVVQQTLQTYSRGATTQTVVERTREIIDRGFHDADFGPETVARELHLSRRQMYRQLSGMGESLAAMIAERRLAEVRDLLIDRPQMRVVEIAAATGFASASALRNRFRAVYGMTPAEFRARGMSEQGGHRIPGEAVDLSATEEFEVLDRAEAVTREG